MYNVLIIEDDPMVAAINRKYTEMDGHFSVMDIFDSGIAALQYPKLLCADLIILDYFMPEMNGAQFLDRLHEFPDAPSVIMVTSANDAETVRALLSRGVIDYLVKPFEYDRFHEALCRFARMKNLLDTGQTIRQADIDRYLSGELSRKPETPEALGKGLNQATLGIIRKFLISHRDRLFTSEQIAHEVGLSRITVRRYVNYMVENGELQTEIDYRTGGRPGINYHFHG